MTKEKPKALKGKLARILRDIQPDGVPYKAGQVVAFTPQQAGALQQDGSVDTHPDSVAYALTQGVQAVAHTVADVAESSPESSSAPTPAQATGADPESTPAP
jgi:hypothetical protein